MISEPSIPSTAADMASTKPLQADAETQAEAKADDATKLTNSTSGAPEPGTTRNGSETQVKTEYAYNRDYRFWCVILALCTMQILCSLENTVVVTSLPTIVSQLSLGSSYIWVTNIFFLAT